VSNSETSSSGAGKYIVLALVLLVVAGGVYWFTSRPEPEPVVESEAEPPPPPVVEREEPPEEEEPAPSVNLPTTGLLVVTANIDGASVLVDGHHVGEAPFEDDHVAAGSHEIRVESEGYVPFVQNIRVRPGRTTELSASLERPPPSLSIVSDVPGATVFLDRNYIGTTPVDIEEVKPGEHELTVSAEGFDMHAETLTVTEGHRDVQISFKKVEINERISVVHKHGFGSCQGVLIADNAGLRYETNHEKDAFSVPYSDLERFEVDYMDKNLNIKVHGGRNYNFEEINGDADALFVFHKNVSEYMGRM
jgi:hypothetical protein